LETLERYDIDANYRPVVRTRIATDPEAAERLFDEYKEANEAGVNIEWLDKDSIRKKINAPKFYGGALITNGLNGTVDPMCLCLGFKKAASNLGVCIF
jgi:glycine/D-amino acid oxidase-like deaminating enzyme